MLLSLHQLQRDRSEEMAYVVIYANTFQAEGTVPRWIATASAPVRQEPPPAIVGPIILTKSVCRADVLNHARL